MGTSERTEPRARRSELQQLQQANRALAAQVEALTAENDRRRRAEQALLSADRRKDEFLAILAHELRNPLAPLANAVEILERIGPRDRELVRMRELIGRQVRHLTRLVDDLLDVSRIAQGKISLRSEPVELGALVRRAIELHVPDVRAHGHELVVDLPDSPVAVTGDPARLTQAVTNLISNAVKYTPGGGRIEVRLTAADGAAAIVVRDNGIGIEADRLEHVFDLFSQGSVKALREPAQDGLGIGLSLVKRLVQMHRGEVAARSDGPGCGCEFTIRLPLRAADRVPRRDNPGLLPRNALAGRRVLVVDDAEDCRESLAEVLRIAGADARTAVDGVAGLEAVEEFGPEVVLLDIRMPRMDGYETARRLRAGAHGDELFLIALTGWGQPEHVEASKLAGFDDHVTKPVDIDELLARIAGRASGGQPRQAASGRH
jgi:signal transduction histidine kinase/ActR/RegA family two-component response regulator